MYDLNKNFAARGAIHRQHSFPPNLFSFLSLGESKTRPLVKDVIEEMSALNVWSWSFLPVTTLRGMWASGQPPPGWLSHKEEASHSLGSQVPRVPSKAAAARGVWPLNGSRVTWICDAIAFPSPLPRGHLIHILRGRIMLERLRKCPLPPKSCSSRWTEPGSLPWEWGEKEGPACFPGWCVSCLGQCSSDFEGYSVRDLLLYFYFPKTPLPTGQKTVSRDK